MRRVIRVGRSGLIVAALLGSVMGATHATARDRNDECGADCLARQRPYYRQQQQQTGGPIFSSDTMRVGPQSRPAKLPSGTGTTVTPNR